MNQEKRKLAEGEKALTKDQRDQLAVDAMLLKLRPRGWARVKDYLQGCLDMAEEDELESKGA